MKIIVGTRGSGKTTDLINWVKQGHVTDVYPFWSRVLVVRYRRQADRLRCGPRAQLDYRQVFYLEEFRYVHRIDPRLEVAIDELEMFLSDLFLGPISVFTISPDSIELASGHKLIDGI